MSCVPGRRARTGVHRTPSTLRSAISLLGDRVRRRSRRRFPVSATQRRSRTTRARPHRRQRRGSAVGHDATADTSGSATAADATTTRPAPGGSHALGAGAAPEPQPPTHRYHHDRDRERDVPGDGQPFPAMSAVAPTTANEGGIVPNMPERRRSPNRSPRNLNVSAISVPFRCLDRSNSAQATVTILSPTPSSRSLRSSKRTPLPSLRRLRPRLVRRTGCGCRCHDTCARWPASTAPPPARPAPAPPPPAGPAPPPTGPAEPAPVDDYPSRPSLPDRRRMVDWP